MFYPLLTVVLVSILVVSSGCAVGETAQPEPTSRPAPEGNPPFRIVETVPLGKPGWFASQAVFSADSHVFAYGNEYEIWCRDMSTGTAAKVGGSHYAPFDLSRDGKTIVCAGPNSDLRIWDRTTGRSATPFTFNIGESITSLAFSPDGQTIVATTLTGGASGRICLLNRSGKPLWQTKVPEGPAYCAAFSPDGARVAVGSAHVVRLLGYIGAGRIRVLEAQNGRVLKVVDDAHKGGVDCLRFSPKGDVLASSGGDSVVRLWNARDMKLLKEFLPIRPKVTIGVAFSADGRFLAATDTERTRFWEVQSGKERPCPPSCRGENTPAFSPDGHYFATWEEGGMLLYGIEWPAETKQADRVNPGREDGGNSQNLPDRPHSNDQNCTP